MPRKNVGTVIDALADLKKQGLKVHFRLAGDGPERSAILEKLDKFSISFEYLGAVSDDFKFRDFYPSLDVFALPVLDLPNDVEGFGIVYLEANAVGTPVVAARTGGVTDAVSPGVSGYFADPTSSEDIARRILQAAALSRSDAVEWSSQFDAAKIARRFSDIYDDLMLRKR